MKHLTAAELSAHLDRASSGRARDAAERHLASCAACRQAIAVLAAQDLALVSALDHDPGEAYFEDFAARVEARLREPAANPDVAGAQGLAAWFKTPRVWGLAGAVAAVLVGAGVVLVTSRESVVSDLRRPELVARTQQVAGRERAAPSAAKLEAPALPNRQERVVSPARDANQPRSALREAGDRSAILEKTKVLDRADDAHARPTRVDADGRSLEGPAPEAQSAPRSATPKAVEGIESAKPAAPERARRVRENEGGPEKRGAGWSGLFSRPPSPAVAPQGSLPLTQGVDGATRVTKPKPAPLSDRLAAPEGKQAPPAPETFAESPNDEAASPRVGATESTANRTQVGALEKVAGDLEPKSAPAARLCGVVRDDLGRPVAGARVVVAELGATAATDADGRFCIDARAGAYTLSVLSVGFVPLRRPITIAGPSEETDVRLQAVSVVGGMKPLWRGVTDVPGQRKDLLRDPFARWPAAAREAAREAERLEARGTRMRSAADLDRAAGAWERALTATRGGEFELDTRQRLADARYGAWEVAPDAKRATSAAEALQGYLEHAQPGPAKQRAEQRLARVRRR